MTGFLAVLVRVTSLLGFSPFLGGRLLPGQVKVVLCLAISALLFPLVHPPQLPNEPMALALALAREALVGACLGMGLRVILGAVEMAGQLMGMQMGLGVTGLLDPRSGITGSVVMELQVALSALAFLGLGLHRRVALVLVESFQALPPGGALPGGLVEGVLRLASELFSLSLRIAAPILGAIFLMNLGLALLSRVIPQVNVFIVAFPLAIGVGLVGMAITASEVAQVVGSCFQQQLGTLLQLLGG